MASLMNYCAVIALLMSLLGVAAERLLATRDAPRRALWALALAASLAYPAVRILPSPQLPPPVVTPTISTQAPKDAEVAVASPIKRETSTPAQSLIRRRHSEASHTPQGTTLALIDSGDSSVLLVAATTPADHFQNPAASSAVAVHSTSSSSVLPHHRSSGA
jgi:hypothetical protein